MRNDGRVFRAVLTVILIVVPVALVLMQKFWWTMQPREKVLRTIEAARNRQQQTPPTSHPAATALTNYAKPETTPRDDLRAVASVLDTFRLLAKGDSLPIGSNEEISAALRGETRSKLALLPHNHPAFDAQGRLVDRWGTPLFFHAQSAKEIEIRSAGPDREFDTADDIVFGAR